MIAEDQDADSGARIGDIRVNRSRPLLSPASPSNIHRLDYDL